MCKTVKYILCILCIGSEDQGRRLASYRSKDTIALHLLQTTVTRVRSQPWLGGESSSSHNTEALSTGAQQ